jgi:hypothetical protein
MAARFAINSDSSEQDLTEVLTVTIGDEAWPQEFPRSRRELPISAAMLEIIRDIAIETGGIIANYVGPISDNVRARLLEVSNVSGAEFHYDHGSAIYLNIPRNVGELLPAEFIQQLTTAPAPDDLPGRSPWLDFAETLYGGAVGECPATAVPVADDATRAERRAAVIKAYRMAAPDLTISYWSNYTARLNPDNDHPNCLINDLIKLYHKDQAASKKIAIDKIITFFGGGETATIARVIDFAQFYKIPAKIYTMTGGFPVCEHIGTVANQRKGFSLIAYQNHCYFGTGKTIANSKPQRLPGIRLPTERYHDEAEQETDAAAEAIRDKFLNECRANFNFISEKRLTSKALNYDNGNYTIEQQKDRVQIDMVKAFHSATINAPDTDKIGVFTVHNTITEIDPQGGSDYVIDPAAYYFVKLETVERWEKSTDIIASRKNNMLLGFELEHLIKTNRIVKNEIEAVKVPSYSVSVKKYKSTLESMGDVCRQQFALCNGLLGRSELREAEHYHSMSPADADLIDVTARAKITQAAAYLNGDEPRCDVAIISGKNEYLHLNNRHLYNWTIAQTNKRIIETYDAMSKAARVLLRVRTDSITWQETDEEEFDIRREALPLAFRLVKDGGKPARLGSYQSIEYLNYKTIMAETHKELDAWNSRHSTVIGPPGAGKSYMIRFAKNDDGTDQFNFTRCMAYTNACARQLSTEKAGKEVKGETIHSTLHLFDPASTRETATKLAGCSIWLDEISQCMPWIWSILYIIGLKSTLIMSGDPRQCSPIGQNEAGKITADRLPWTTGYLLQAMQKTATIIKDGPKSRNDKQLIEFRELIDTHADPLHVLTSLLKKFPGLDGKDKNAEILALDSHIVFSNAYRVELNAAIVKARGLVWEYKIKTPGNRLKSPICEFNASATLKLIARTTIKAVGLYKGAAYVLRDAVTPVSTEAILIAEDGGDIVKIKPSDLSHLTLGYARTSYSAQGSTIRSVGAIHQCSGMLFEGEHREIFYTGITRWTKLDNIRFITGKLILTDHQEAQPEISGLRGGDADDSLGADLIVN